MLFFVVVIVCHSFEAGIITVAVFTKKGVKPVVDGIEGFFVCFGCFELVEVLVVKPFSGGNFTHQYRLRQTR